MFMRGKKSENVIQLETQILPQKVKLSATIAQKRTTNIGFFGVGTETNKRNAIQTSKNSSVFFTRDLLFVFTITNNQFLTIFIFHVEG